MLEPRAARARDRVRSRRRDRRLRALFWVLRVLVVVLVFFAGLAVGRALEEGPEPGVQETRLRTLVPETVPPAGRTVTVTTAGP